MIKLRKNKAFSSPKPSFVIILFLLSISLCKPLHADPASLDTFLNEVKQRSEQLQLSQDDPYKILPRIDQAEEASRNGDSDLARKILKTCEFDLDLLESRRAVDNPDSTWKQARLEMFFDLIRQYFLTAILALLIVKLPWFRRRSGQPRFSNWGKVLLLMMATLIFGWTDIARYGGQAWSYFDIQIVGVACAGLLAGWLPALVMSLILIIVRLQIQPDLGNGSLVLAGAALISGLIFLIARQAERKAWFAALTGILAGSLHGLMLYFSSQHSLPGNYLIFSSTFVAVSEALAIFLFFIIVDRLLHEEKQEEVKHELVRSQLLFLQAQINPHFLFNTLGTISAICDRENAPEAREVTEHLADFFQHALETKDHISTIGKELGFVDAYLKIEKARHGDAIQIIRDIHLDEPARNTKIPILILQPIVENAIRHGLRKKSGVGTLTLFAKEDSQTVTIQIQDDGAGKNSEFFKNYLKDDKIKAEGHGIGVRNIDERLRRFFGKGEWVKFETSSGKGTIVIITIPKAKTKD